LRALGKKQENLGVCFRALYLLSEKRNNERSVILATARTKTPGYAMPIYKKTAELARKFDAAYPQELSARLQWWGEALGIDRVRLLRLIGMSAHQAASLTKSEDLFEVLKDPQWEKNAQMVEGSLHTLLSLFQYDWHALAERIHSPLAEGQGEPHSRTKRRNGKVTGLRYTPNGASSDLLINRMAEGGPESLSALVAYLS
jgi:hypothetical protein